LKDLARVQVVLRRDRVQSLHVTPLKTKMVKKTKP
jgi:hypothetical protein